MDRFQISQDIANLLPDMRVVVIAAYNLSNSVSNSKVTEFVQDTTTTTLGTLSSYPNAQSHPRIALYRNTLKATLNLPAKKFPQSNESLYKRLLKDRAPLRPINPVVDFYNAISIKHAVTAGAFDLGELQTRGAQPLELRMSAKGDVFRALDAPDGKDAEAVADGEAVYAQGTEVLTRHLAWRQAKTALVTDATTNVLFVSEVLGEGKEGEETGTGNLAAQVAEDLVRGLKELFGVEAQAEILGKSLGRLSVEVHNAFF